MKSYTPHYYHQYREELHTTLLPPVQGRATHHTTTTSTGKSYTPHYYHQYREELHTTLLPPVQGRATHHTTTTSTGKSYTPHYYHQYREELHTTLLPPVQGRATHHTTTTSTGKSYTPHYYHQYREELHTTLLPPVQDTDVDRLTCCPAGGIAPCPAQGGLLQQEESLCLVSTPPPLIDMPQPLLPSAVSPPAECLRSAEERRRLTQGRHSVRTPRQALLQ